MERSKDGPAALRVLRILATGPARISPMARPGKVLLQAGARGAISVDEGELATLAASGSIRREGDRVWLAEAASAGLAGGGEANKGARRRGDLQPAFVQTEEGPAHVFRNLAESPLGSLARRKDRHGAPFLSPAEFEAGERLRADYTRGQLMPKLGVNWGSTLSSGRRGGAGGAVELTEAALASRQRVDGAIRAVGPELSGVLIDVCCFLKGLEQIERERGWPVRSAKIMLKSALGVLARHYATPSGATRRGPQHPLNWGAPGYRPSLF